MEPNGTADLRQRDTKHAIENDAKVHNNSTNDVNVVVFDDKKVNVVTTETKEQGRLSKLKHGCIGCCTPCLRSRNPLPSNPNLFQRFRNGLMFPPQGNLASYLQFAVVCIQIWIVMYALTHGEALPGGNLFSLLILFIACAIGGYFISFIHLPPLLGMLIVGVMLRNIPGIKTVGESIDTKWSGALRKLALTVILTRAGLGLDPIKLKKLSWAVLRLAWTPCVAEAITVAIVSHFLLGFPWKWSLMLGCILGALSPAVTVPSLVNLQDRQYGIAKGIPTMLLAAGGLDNVMCVTGFSVFLGIIFSEGDLAVTIIKGPIGVIVGIVYGFIMGISLWYLPAKDCANHVFFRSMLLFGCGMVAIFGSSAVGLSGAGPLGCLTTATVAAYKWRQRRQPGEQDEIAGVMALAWLIVQHFLFGLIGAAVNIGDIQPNTAGLGIATLAIGLVVRSTVSFTVTLGIGFNLKERIFVTLTWIAKATVQAAIGGLALDRVMEEENPLESDIKLGTDVLTLSVLAIIICAPVGATLMAVLGPRFLVKGHEDDAEVEVHTKEESSKTMMAVYDGSNNEKGETNWAFVNDLQTDNEVKIYAAETDVQTGQICNDCEEKEMADLNETFTKENAPIHENAPVKDTITILTVDDTDISKLSTASNTEDSNGMQEVLSESRVTEDTKEVQMRNDVLGNDSSVDKSTDTDNVQKDGKRPLYVSSIVVELNDNKV